MVVFVNGAFGIGKTTAAAQLRRRRPGSAIFDPEPLGLVLRSVAVLLPLEGRGSDDFQDLALWRRGTLLGIRGTRALRRTVIVPMAFSNLAYLCELLEGVRRFDPDVRHFCLTAPFEVVRARLEQRGATPWQLRRAAECCAVHSAREFGEPLATERLGAQEVAAELDARLGAG